MPAPTIARLPVAVKVLDADFKSHACPRCGTESPRHDGAVRYAYDLDLGQAVVLQIHVGVYRCPRCPKKKGRYFRTPLAFIAPRQHFVTRCRTKLVEAVELDQMPIGRAVVRMKRDFHVSIAPSTGWEWHRAGAPSDEAVAEYEHLVAEHFSGVLAVDEVYDGDYAILVACDPLTKRTVAYELCEGVNQAKVIAFFEQLATMGITPEVVTTDASPLYPKAIKAVWANCKHQLCRFHWTKDIVTEVAAGIRAYGKSLPKERPARHGGEDKRQSSARDEVRKARKLLVMRPEKLTEPQQERLAVLTAKHPALDTIRAFMTDFYGLFEGKPSPTEANRRRERLLDEPAYVDSPYLAEALASLEDHAKFAKVCVFLAYDNLDSTSNAAERDNRGFRKRQKTHYRLRDERSIEVMLRRRRLRAGPPVSTERLRRRTVMSPPCLPTAEPASA